MPATDSEISKFMSYALRHAPREAGIVLDREGWTDFAVFSAKLRDRFGASDGDIQRVIEENSKKRFTLSGGRIRAAQGHSVAVDLKLRATTPPVTLFHGTTADAWNSIRKQGLKPMSRHHVHLSPDADTAMVVAARRKGTHVLLRVDAKKMLADGCKFYRSDNGVWLTDRVPPSALTLVRDAAPGRGRSMPQS